MSRRTKYIDLNDIELEDKYDPAQRMQKARLSRRAQLELMEKPPRPAKPPRYKKKRSDFIAAIEGSGGIIQLIADRMGCTWETVRRYLQNPDPKWDRVRVAYNSAVEAGIDTAESTIIEMIGQRKDLAVAAQTARWFLGHKRANIYGEKATVTHEGTVRVNQLNVTLDTLDLPLDVKRMILEKMDAKEEELKQKQLADER